MTLIQHLRKDIEQALTDFMTQDQPSVKRIEEIAVIRMLLTGNNPLKLRRKILNYLESLSAGGLLDLWPFSEINRFKRIIRAALESYPETRILMNMLQEMGVNVEQEAMSYPDGNHVLARLDRLENALATQKREVERLRNENKFLLDAIALLVDKNQKLTLESEEANHNREEVIAAYTSLKQAHEKVLKENADLKRQVATLQNAKAHTTPPIDKPKARSVLIKEKIDSKKPLPDSHPGACLESATFSNNGRSFPRYVKV